MPDDVSDEDDGILRNSAFVGGLDSYPGVIKGIEELLAEVAPHVAKLDTPDRAWAPLSEAVGSVPLNRRQDVLDVLRPHIESGPFLVRPLLLDIIKNFMDQPWGPRLVTALKETLSRRPRTPILLNSLLTHAVSAFELHLGTVAGSIYQAAPKALEASAREPEFSLLDLKDLGSIEEAMQLAVSRRVDRLSRGNLADWRKHLKDSVGIDLSTLSIDYGALNEIMQRRNVVVHHDATASRQYITSTGRTDISVGDDLSCNAKYVQAALDELLAVGFLLSLECFRKFDKDEGYACRRLHQLEESLLPTDRWRLMEKISSHGLTYADDAMGRQVFQVNVWLARKRMHGLESVRDEVSKWDVTASDNLLVVARSSLLDELDTVFDLLPDLVEHGPLAGSDVLTWPLFEELRQDPRFGSLKESILKSVEEEEEEDGVREFVGSPRSRTFHLSDCGRAGQGAAPLPALRIYAWLTLQGRVPEAASRMRSR